MIVYKYLKFEHVIDNLKVNKAFLDSPLNYNDPFDRLPKPTNEEYEENFKLIINYYTFKSFCEILFDKKIKKGPGFFLVKAMARFYKLLMKIYPFYDTMIFFNWIYENYVNSNPKFKEQVKEIERGKQKFVRTINESIEDLNEKLRICCFSLRWDSILMWSHYADKHQGVCIEYEVDKKTFRKVRYSKRRKRLNLKNITGIVLGYDFIGKKIEQNDPKILKSIERLFYRKSKDWKYEDEVRVIRHTDISSEDFFLDKTDGKYYFKMPVAKRVYAGCQIKDSDYNKLVAEFPNIEVIKLKERNTRYKVSEASQKNAAHQ